VIVELVGPMGSGKTTIAAIVAERTGLQHVPAQGAHRADAQPLSPTELRLDRFLAVMAAPRLFAAAIGDHHGPWRSRLSFAFLTCRRARRIRQISSGVVDGGPLHALAQEVEKHGGDYSRTARRLPTPTIYVELRVPPEQRAIQLEQRDGTVGDIAEGTLLYRAALRRYARAPVIQVDGGALPADVAITVHEAIQKPFRRL
jgi:hypothetical protein